MKKKLLFGLILLICFALTGIIGVQFFWIRNAMTVKTEAFNRSVNEALNQTVNRLEMRDNMVVLSRNFSEAEADSLLDEFPPDPFFDMRFRFDSLLAGSNLDFQLPPPPPPLPSGNYQELEFSVRSDRGCNTIQDKIVISGDDSSLTKVIVVNGHDTVSRGTMKQNIHRKLNRKARILRDVLDRMTIHLETDRVPVEKRINEKTLQRFLSRAMSDRGIDIPFEFAVQSPLRSDNPLPIKSARFEPDFLSTTHRIYLFPNDIFGKPDLLLVHFPSQRVHLYKSMGLLLGGSLLFTFIIVITSILSIIIMIRQKKVSEIKSDFINNMTHEFKTPIATISIAVDSINNPKIIESPEKIRTYTQIIREENTRMNTRVEQVLQMSLLESREFRLSLQHCDLHSMIRNVAAQFSLQVQNRNGRLDLQLTAERHHALVDESHFSNVLMTIIDNAVKYSPEKPEIIISTASPSGMVQISIQDKGIGMSEETQKKIFEKFFRVTTGNIHNVKGFGLGLSYAKAIILAHKGSITVRSESGAGSRFDVFLPQARPDDPPDHHANTQPADEQPE